MSSQHDDQGGEMNLAMVLQRILELVLNVMLVFNTTYGKKQGLCLGMIDVHSIGTRLKKQSQGGETICEEGLLILEVCASPWVMKV